MASTERRINRKAWQRLLVRTLRSSKVADLIALPPVVD
jgi:hypothetical protein